MLKKLSAVLAILVIAAAPAHAQKKGAAKTAAPIPSADTSKTATADQWVASRSSKKMEYYKAGCDKAKEIKGKNLVHFKTEQDAQKAGYTRSTRKGC